MMWTEEALKNRALTLLAETDLGNELPIQVEQIANKLGFDLHFYIPDEDINDIAGAVNHIQKKIYVNQNNSLFQQRLSIARNIGCIVLFGKEQDYIIYLRVTNDPKERLVNYFAENLLMPENIFKQQWFATAQNILELSQIFGVTQFTIINRASVLNLR